MSNVPTPALPPGQAARLAVLARRAGRRGAVQQRVSLPGMVGQCLFVPALCTLSCRGILRIGSSGSASDLPRSTCARLARRRVWELDSLRNRFGVGARFRGV
jgi:hypothetical protein